MPSTVFLYKLMGLKKTPRVAVTWLSYIYGPELIREMTHYCTCAGIAHLCLTRLHALNLGNLYLGVQQACIFIGSYALCFRAWTN